MVVVHWDCSLRELEADPAATPESKSWEWVAIDLPPRGKSQLTSDKRKAIASEFAKRLLPGEGPLLFAGRDGETCLFPGFLLGVRE